MYSLTEEIRSLGYYKYTYTCTGSAVITIYAFKALTGQKTVLGINDRSEYSKTKDQSSAALTKQPRRRGMSSPLRVPSMRGRTNALYVVASKLACSSSLNGAVDNAQSMSPMSHMGTGEGVGGLLL